MGRSEDLGVGHGDVGGRGHLGLRVERGGRGKYRNRETQGRSGGGRDLRRSGFRGERVKKWWRGAAGSYRKTG